MTQQTRITRDDLESKFRALQADLQGRASDKRQSIVAVASGAAAVVLIVVYLLGRRSGRQGGRRVEIRRY